MSCAPSPLRRLSQQGFSLIEVIIALVVFAVLSLVLWTIFGSSLTSSSEPMFRLQKTMALHQVMENIRANFSATPDLALLKVDIGTGTQNNSFGAYEVVNNDFIKFTTYAEAPGVVGDGILKVTIKDQTSGLTLTELFVEW